MVKIRGSYRKHIFDENIKVPDRTLRRTKTKKKLKNTVENQILIYENNNIPEHHAVNFNTDTIVAEPINQVDDNQMIVSFFKLLRLNFVLNAFNVSLRSILTIIKIILVTTI